MNNLFKDYKHNKDFLSLIHYKIGYKLYNFISSKNHPNFIIYGVNNSGKTLLVKTILNDLYNIYKYTNIETLTDNINYEHSHIHYYFDLQKINNNIIIIQINIII